MEAVEKLLNETVEQLSNILKVTPSLAKVLLIEYKWKISEIVEKYRCNETGFQIKARIKPSPSSNRSTKKYHLEESCSSSTSSSSSTYALSPSSSSSSVSNREQVCSVCATSQPPEKYFNLSCSHSFCKDCWTMHFETQINQGIFHNKLCIISPFRFKCIVNYV